MAATFPGNGIAILISLGFVLASGAATFGIWHHELAPIQAVYLPVYLKAEYLPNLSLVGQAAKPKRYSVLTVKGNDANLSTMPDTMETVSVRYREAMPEAFAFWLRVAVYNRQTGLELLEKPLILWGAFVFLSIMAVAIFSKRQRRKALNGIKLRGPDMMTVDQFNNVTQGDGFALRTQK